MKTDRTKLVSPILFSMAVCNFNFLSLSIFLRPFQDPSSTDVPRFRKVRKEEQRKGKEQKRERERERESNDSIGKPVDTASRYYVEIRRNESRRATI